MSDQIRTGIRTDEFRKFIRSLLKRGKLKKEHINTITDEEGMKTYSQIFTDPTVDRVNNYEFYELMGDKIANTSILKYFSKKYPMLRRPEGVTVLSRLVILYGSKETFAKVGLELEFDKYISANEFRHSKERKQMIEDCFEAFFGYTAEAIDERITPGAGFPICYNIINSIMEGLGKLSINYYDLVDSKTLLKETYDQFAKDLYFEPISKKSYVWERNQNDTLGTMKIIVNHKETGNKIELATAQGSLKRIGEQNAAKYALERLKREKFQKDIPAVWKLFGLDKNDQPIVPKDN